MKTDTQTPAIDVKLVSIKTKASPEVTCCAQCKTELRIISNVTYTRFGLDLCEDCLYS